MNSFILSSLAIVAFAALIHASFQLSISVLTLVSGHAIGRKTAHKRTLRLMSGFIIGAALMTGLLIFTITYCFSLAIWKSLEIEQLTIAISCGLLGGLGIATWAFYYRKGPGTSLWLPRNFAHYLTTRAKATKESTEAFGLGMTSVVSEIIFIIAPMIAASITIAMIPDVGWQLVGLGIYLMISLMPLLIIFLMVGGGKKITKIQIWREQNKQFLQFVSGGSLIILATYLFIDRVLGVAIYGGW